ncbi:metal ABC transporter permease, partial [Patescibacteria group bacterium]|nr:metal ABC transporter permease [Patescibacteria group bacterium]
LKEYSLGSAVLGILSCFFGILLFRFAGFPVGPAIILTSTFFFLISLIFKR